MLIRWLLLLVWNPLMVLLFLVHRGFFALGRLWGRGKHTWVWVRPPRTMRLQRARGLRGWFSRTTTWLDWVKGLRRLERDRVVQGIVLDLSERSSALASSEVLAGRIDSLRAAGKQVAVYGHAYETGHLVVASHADRVLMSPPGRLSMLGMRAQLIFWRGFLERLGVKPQFVHIGAYKTAAHGFLRRTSSEAQRENVETLLSGLWEYIESEVVSGRSLKPVDWEAARHRGFLDGGRSRALGLVDHVVYPDQVKDVLGEGVRVVKQRNFGGTPALNWKPFLRGRSVAVVDMRGVIVMGEGGGGMRESVGYHRFAKALDALRKDGSVCAVVLHIDSPGGSALASDLLWRVCVRLSAKKPVVVAMGSVAASGGYYLAACGARRVYAQRSTITGSIGVVAGKFSVGSLLDQLPVYREVVDRGQRAGFFSVLDALSEEEMAILRRDAWTVYRRFVDRVAQGRGLGRSEVHALGEGRVYTGAQALEVGLVDALGDLHDAIEHARSLGGLRPGSGRIEVWPRSREGLLTALGRGDSDEGDLLHELKEAAWWCHALAQERIWTMAPLDVLLHSRDT